MSAAREELQQVMSCYIRDTLQDINTVKDFCEKSCKWMLGRETELNMMIDIKERADSINLAIGHVTKSKNKSKAFKEYMGSKFTKMTADERHEELEKELAGVLKDTLSGLEELDYFLDAVENLAVTSLPVFMENQMLQLPEGISHEDVHFIITSAWVICPQLLQFKRDASVFFSPKLQNVEVLSYQLDRYIQTTQKVCAIFTCSFVHFSLELNDESLVDLEADLSEDDIQRMLSDINELDEIRKNQSFRTVFLFQEEQGSSFITQFSERRSRMLQSLKDLEEAAVQLDSMCKGAKISSVAGSSVGAAGGVLSIIGLALSPVTAGASLILTMTGVGLGVTSGLNSLVTTATEIGVNSKHQKKSSEVFQNLMEDVQSLQDCLEKVRNRETDPLEVALGVGKVLCKAGAIGKGIDSIVDAASAVKLLKAEDLAVSAGPDIGQAVAKGPLALSKTARAGFIGLNALFIGMDIFFICKDSISLAKGSETKFSQFIRVRAALWSSEINSWQKIYDFLTEGLPTSKKNKAALERSFYPERKEKGKKKEPNWTSMLMKWMESK